MLILKLGKKVTIMTYDKNDGTLNKSPQTIQTMFNMLAANYDHINDIMSFGTQKSVKEKAIFNLDIKPHDNVIDLCCGTGDLAGLIKKHHPASCVTGIDFSERMLEIAKDKHPNIKFFQGDVTQLPYEDNSFDIAVMGFGLRNIQNAEKAVEEVYRILRHGGQFLHLDFGRKNLASKIYDKIFPLLISNFTENHSAYRYLIKSKESFPTPSDLIKDFESKGFKLKKREDYLFGVISTQIFIK